MSKKKLTTILTRDNFKEDVKSERGFKNPLTQILKKEVPKKSKPKSK